VHPRIILDRTTTDEKETTMALGLVYGGGGSILPFCKYDARSGRFFRVDRVLNSSGKYENSAVEIAFKAVMDLENVEKGFMRFVNDQAPQYLLVPADAQMPPKPQAEGWKQGLRVMVKLDDSCGGDVRVREITSNAEVFAKGLDALHDQYELEKSKHPGKLPVVEVRSTKPVSSGGGGKRSTNYQPQFDIVGWVVRPDDLVFVPKQQSEASPDYDPYDDPEYHKSLGQ
jgi:hypothetical protein